MAEELARNGGVEVPDYRIGRCTHIVADTDKVTSMPEGVKAGETFVVRCEWFWASIQMDACAEEKMYLLSDALAPTATSTTPSAFLSPRPGGYFSPGGSTPGSHGRRKKRRTEAVRQLAQSDNGANLAQAATTTTSASTTPSATKRARSSLGEVPDTPDKKNSSSRLVEALSPGRGAKHQPESSPAASTDVKSARQQVFAELVQTEENYVNILRTIVEVFKRPLEEDPKMTLLNQTQMKIIFGGVPPILAVHEKMLADLSALLRDWREPVCIGDVIGRYSGELMRAYPPFVNFFENAKKTLEECDRAIPRFHAFLKVCEGRRECGRQTLAELLIRPVQRLASVSLLLTDLLKHTRKEKGEHRDGPALEAALASVKEVLRNINEDKRKTEGQVHIFEIFSDIENCPPHLVSSHRKYLHLKFALGSHNGSFQLPV